MTDVVVEPTTAVAHQAAAVDPSSSSDVASSEAGGDSSNRSTRRYSSAGSSASSSAAAVNTSGENADSGVGLLPSESVDTVGRRGSSSASDEQYVDVEDGCEGEESKEVDGGGESSARTHPEKKQFVLKLPQFGHKVS
jgi:hypothetical protein